MREIKFRAFDKVFKSWHEWDHIKECNLSDYIEDERFHVVQFTGLLDKNENEIYEGDILTNVKDYRKLDLLVKWNEDECFYGLLNSRGWSLKKLTKNNVKSAEIIENVYETGELL